MDHFIPDTDPDLTTTQLKRLNDTINKAIADTQLERDADGSWPAPYATICQQALQEMRDFTRKAIADLRDTNSPMYRQGHRNLTLTNEAAEVAIGVGCEIDIDDCGNLFVADWPKSHTTPEHSPMPLDFDRIACATHEIAIAAQEIHTAVKENTANPRTLNTLDSTLEEMVVAIDTLREAIQDHLPWQVVLLPNHGGKIVSRHATEELARDAKASYCSRHCGPECVMVVHHRRP